MVDREGKSAGTDSVNAEDSDQNTGKKRMWTASEDQSLQNLVKKHGAKN